MKSGFVIKLIASIIVMATGVLMFFFGITSAFYCGGSYVPHETYGGDAYTGIQNAAADTANNVDSLGGLLSDVANATSFIGGLLVIALGLFLLGKAVHDKSLAQKMAASNEAPAPAPQAPAYQAPQYQQPRY